MADQRGFFDLDDRYRALSAAGDPLERLAAAIDFEVFRADLETALVRSDRAKGGRPPYEAVLMFMVLGLQVLYGLSDDQAEFPILDRRSFGRFLGLDDGDRIPDAKTIWLFRERLTRVGAMQRLFERFDRLLHDRGYLAMGGQIVGATVIDARRPRLNSAEKKTIKGGGTPAHSSKAKRAQMDTDGRWTLKRGRKKPVPDGSVRTVGEIVVPSFGDKNHIGVDRRLGLIRTFAVTHAAVHDGGQLGRLLDPNNLASGVRAETAYRSKANVDLLEHRGLVPQFKRAKPRGRPMPVHIARGNATRGRIRARVEHVSPNRNGVSS
jgi:IS5 family transposase